MWKNQGMKLQKIWAEPQTVKELTIKITGTYNIVNFYFQIFSDKEKCKKAE